MKLQKIAAILTATLLLAGCGGSGDSASRPTVTTQNGQVVGVERNGANEYRGIPYATAERWALPVPAAAWSAPLDATNFGPACPQTARFNLTEASADENCLSINVSTPTHVAPGEKLPVFVWIHGGAFIGGASNLYRLDKLAREGRMVVVSMNYRIGALGFMPNPAFQVTNSAGSFNGNFGLEDQRLAMRWVQQNIGAFGGDKNNVTVAGESAGAGSVCTHLSAPTQVAGLFQKAVIQSFGCMTDLRTVTQSQEPGLASVFMQNELCPAESTSAAVLACMRSKSVAQILAAQEKYTDSHPFDTMPFWPVTGSSTEANTTVPTSFKAALTNNTLVTVPMIYGGTQSELDLYVGYYWQANNYSVTTQPGIDALLSIFYMGDESRINAIKTRYPGLSNFDNFTAAKTLGTAVSDYNPAAGINNCTYLQTSNAIKNNHGGRYVANPIYQFEFADPDAPVCGVGIAEPCPPFAMTGPVHSSELNYFFPNLSNTAAINAPNLKPKSQILADQMVAYWAQFAATGNPNKAGLADWPVYNGSTGSNNVLRFMPGAIATFDADAEHQCSSFWSNTAYDPPMYRLPNAPPF